MKRTFSSYGPVSTESNYYVPRKELIEKVHQNLMGDNPEEGGHYFTVWAPRQTGKTWVVFQVCQKIESEGIYDVAYISMGRFKEVNSYEEIIEGFIIRINQLLQVNLPIVNNWHKLQSLFVSEYGYIDRTI